MSIIKYQLMDELDFDLFDPVYDGGSGAAGVELNTNTITGNALLSPENKVFYDRALIRLAEAELIHDQFGQERDIPAGNGDTIEFRQFDSLPEITAPLAEGITPKGQSLRVTSTTAQLRQYGGYVTLSDRLQLTALDPVITEATEAIASQAGRSMDTITREIINAGTYVRYAMGTGSTPPVSRSALAYTSASSNNNLTVEDIKLAVRELKRANARTINGSYVGIVHPDVVHDLMRDPLWLNPHTYVDTANIYRGEVGQLYGVRFVENTRAKTWGATNLTAGSRTLTVKTAVTNGDTLEVKEEITYEDASGLVGREVLVGSTAATIASAAFGAAGKAAVTLTAPIASAAADAVISPTGGGASGVTVYSSLILGKDAYGVTKLGGRGIEHIVKQLGSGGTSDPIDQRSTVGWKAYKTAKILVQQYMVRIESTATP